MKLFNNCLVIFNNVLLCLNNFLLFFDHQLQLHHLVILASETMWMQEKNCEKQYKPRLCDNCAKGNVKLTESWNRESVGGTLAGSPAVKVSEPLRMSPSQPIKGQIKVSTHTQTEILTF